MKRKNNGLEKNQVIAIIAIIFIILFIVLAKQGFFTKVIIIQNNSLSAGLQGGGSSGGGSSGGNQDGSNQGGSDNQGGGGTTPSCSDSDGGNYPLIKGTVDVPRLAVMYPDRCTGETFNRYLTEWYCDSNNVARSVTVDCWLTYNAVCMDGACRQPACEAIVNPNSQEDCDRGHPCVGYGEETYCKYIPATSATASKCACTIEPSSITSCERACWFNGFGSGYCYTGTLTRDPCGTATHISTGDSYCSRPLGGLPTCCCN